MQELADRVSVLPYEECFLLYPTLETREERAVFLYTMAHRQKAFIDRKDNLTTITEIKDYVRELPTLWQAQRDLTVLVDQFQAQRPLDMVQ